MSTDSTFFLKVLIPHGTFTDQVINEIKGSHHHEDTEDGTTLWLSAGSKAGIAPKQHFRFREGHTPYFGILIEINDTGKVLLNRSSFGQLQDNTNCTLTISNSFVGSDGKLRTHNDGNLQVCFRAEFPDGTYEGKEITLYRTEKA